MPYATKGALTLTLTLTLALTLALTLILTLAPRNERLKSPLGNQPSPLARDRPEPRQGEPTALVVNESIGSAQSRVASMAQSQREARTGNLVLEEAKRIVSKEQIVLDELSREAQARNNSGRQLATAKPVSFLGQVAQHQDWNPIANNSVPNNTSGGLDELLVLEGLLEAELTERSSRGVGGGGA